MKHNLLIIIPGHTLAALAPMPQNDNLGLTLNLEVNINSLEQLDEQRLCQMLQTKVYAIAAGAVSVVALIVLQNRRNRRYDLALHSVTTSPREYVVLELSKKDKSELAYHPDQFQGARDIWTPWGNTRAYEFGPENGQKVLFVHGISTPCISLGEVANEFVNRGCRVILYGKSSASV
jgi:hypothetical protein